MNSGAVILVGLLLVAWLGIWAKCGFRAALVILMVAGAVVGYVAYAGGFNH